MRQRPLLLLTLFSGVAVAAAFAMAAAQEPYPIQATVKTGGEGTVDQFDHNAYSLPQANLSMTRQFLPQPLGRSPCQHGCPRRTGATVQHQLLPGLSHKGWPWTSSRR